MHQNFSGFISKVSNAMSTKTNTRRAAGAASPSGKKPQADDESKEAIELAEKIANQLYLVAKTLTTEDDLVMFVHLMGKKLEFLKGVTPKQNKQHSIVSELKSVQKKEDLVALLVFAAEHASEISLHVPAVFGVISTSANHVAKKNATNAERGAFLELLVAFHASGKYVNAYVAKGRIWLSLQQPKTGNRPTVIKINIAVLDCESLLSVAKVAAFAKKSLDHPKYGNRLAAAKMQRLMDGESAREVFEDQAASGDDSSEGDVRVDSEDDEQVDSEEDELQEV